MTRICVNFSTVYNDTLVAKGLMSSNRNVNKWMNVPRFTLESQLWHENVDLTKKKPYSSRMRIKKWHFSIKVEVLDFELRRTLESPMRMPWGWYIYYVDCWWYIVNDWRLQRRAVCNKFTFVHCDYSIPTLVLSSNDSTTPSFQWTGARPEFIEGWQTRTRSSMNLLGFEFMEFCRSWAEVIFFTSGDINDSFSHWLLCRQNQLIINLHKISRVYLELDRNSVLVSVSGPKPAHLHFRFWFR